MFQKLDNESREILKKLATDSEKYKSYFIITEEYPRDIIESLIIKGYLNVGPQGVRSNSNGGYCCMATVTREGKIYDQLEKEYKEDLEKEKSSSVFNGNVNVGFMNCTNLTNCTSNVIVKDCYNDNTYIDNSIKEFESLLDKEKLTDEDRQDIVAMLEDIKEKNKKKKPSLIKSALMGLWDFTKSIGASVLAAYLATKFGF